MTALLCILVVAQPAPDESAHVVNKLAEQLVAASRIMEKDPEEAIRLLNALLDDPRGRKLEDRSPNIRSFREQALYTRGRLQLQQGQAQAVAREMTALLARQRSRMLAQVAGIVGALASPPHACLGVALSFPPWYPLNRAGFLHSLALRADAYKALGQQEKEQADRAEMQEITREMMKNLGRRGYQPPEPPGWLAWMQREPQRLLSWVTGSLFVATIFVVVATLFFLHGLRQRREAGGAWRRLILVSLALAALQTAPVVAAFLLLRWRPELVYAGNLVAITILVFGINAGWHAAHLAPVRLPHTRKPPPSLEDAAVHDRIGQLAQRMGISPPLTRVVHSASSVQRNQALVTGLAAPTMVLYDGILHRLTEDERDAIIAHELAHLANHTFRYWLLSAAVCSVAIVAASAFYSFLVACALGLVLWTGSWLILSRWFELDSDRRAARAMGHRQAASALWKIHADHPFRGVMEFLIGAVASHPSRDERLAAIHKDAPENDKPNVEWNPRLLGYRRLASWCAGGLWLSVIAGCLLWGYQSPDSRWPALPLALMEAALFGLFWLGMRKGARRQRRLLRTRRYWRKRVAWLAAVLFGGLLIAESFGLTRPYLNPMTSYTLLGGGFLAWLGMRIVVGRDRAGKLNHQLLAAIQSGDYRKALDLAEGSLAIVASDVKLRYNHALIRAVLGRRQEALSDLEQLRRDEPGFHITLLFLVTLYTDEGEHARALELACQLSRDLPGDAAGPEAESWLLRKLGRLEEAELRARAVLKMEPHSGSAHLTLAAVAFDRGDDARAHEELAQAERFLPGSVRAALIAAEMALARDDSPEAAVQKAVRAARNNPLSFAEKQVASLVQRLEGRQASTRNAAHDPKGTVDIAGDTLDAGSIAALDKSADPEGDSSGANGAAVPGCPSPTHGQDSSRGVSEGV